MEKKVTKWLGSCNCDICKKDIKKAKENLYDTATIYGPWATMCQSCYESTGIAVGQLGTGLGQEYALNDKGEYEKVRG